MESINDKTMTWPLLLNLAHIFSWVCLITVLGLGKGSGLSL